MTDVVTTCKTGVDSLNMTSGRVVVRSYFYSQPIVKVVDPKINEQASSGVLIARYTNRFDDPRYYQGDTAN